jgi:hypothetical protein
MHDSVGDIDTRTIGAKMMVEPVTLEITREAMENHNQEYVFEYTLLWYPHPIKSHATYKVE